ncbi:hypothetical protein N8865_01920 [Francisellaceae bacterium]|nr:hypothetical protein [Francisellaceae bacterium]
MKKFLILSVCILLLSGCASEPEFYHNSEYNKEGKSGTELAVKECTHKAHEYLKSPAVKSTLKGAGAGAGAGALLGLGVAFIGNEMFGGLFGLTSSVAAVGVGAAAGAATGAATGAAVGTLSPDKVRKNYIDKCLKDKGYQLVGWS